jgi:hypothetical protein
VRRRSRRRSWGSDPSQVYSRLRVSGRFPRRPLRCTTLSSLVGIDSIAHTASARPGPPALGRSSTPDGIGRGIGRPDRICKRAAGRGFAAVLLGFAPVCGPRPPPFVFCGGAILPWVLSSPLSGCCTTCDRAGESRILSRSAVASWRALFAHRASPSFFGRTRHSPGPRPPFNASRGSSVG